MLLNSDILFNFHIFFFFFLKDGIAMHFVSGQAWGLKSEEERSLSKDLKYPYGQAFVLS